MENKRRYVGFVRGNPQDLTRELIIKEFGTFGKITKVFITEDKSYAKVYFDDQKQLQEACKSLNKFRSWIVNYKEDTYSNKGNLYFSSSSTSSVEPISNMDDDYDDCTVLTGFVDIHGNDLEVLEGDGQYFISLASIKKSGFCVFRKDQYIPEIIDNRQKLREFELFLLAEGKRYLIDNKTKFREEEILDTIERVKLRLLKGETQNGVSASGDHENSVGGNRQDQPGSSRPSNNLKFTTENQRWQQQNQRQQPQQQQQAYEFNRPPKQLDGQFKPSSRNFPPAQQNRNQGNREGNQGFQGNREGNRGFQGNREGNQGFQGNRDGNQGFQGNREGSKGFQGNREGNQGNRGKFESNGGAKPALYSKEPGDQPQMRKPQQYAANNNSEKEESWDEDSVKGTRRKKTQIEPDDISKAKLRLNEPNKVKVTYTMERKDKTPIYHVNLSENASLSEDLLVKVYEAAQTQPTITPEIGQLCLAESEGAWYRAIVTGLEPTRVDLLDFGNREVIRTAIKKFPDSFKTIPTQSIRCTLCEESKPSRKIEIDDELVVHAKKMFEGGTFVIEIIEESTPNEASSKADVPKVEAPKVVPKKSEEITHKPPEVKTEIIHKPQEIKTEEFTTMKTPLCTLKSGDTVMVVAVDNGMFYMRNKDCALKMRNVKEHIESMEKKPLTSVKPGQQVLASKDGLLGLHRATVVTTDGIVADIEYLDYPGTEKLLIKSLRNVDDTLANIPKLILTSPVIPTLNDLSESAERFLLNIITEKQKFLTEVTGDKFDLTLEGESLVHTLVKLSRTEKEEKAKEKEKEKPVEKKESVTKASEVQSDVIMYKDMDILKAKVGSAEYMLYMGVENEVSLIPVTEEAQDLLARVLSYEPSGPGGPYKPHLFEMCLTLFEDTWSRCTPVEEMKTGGYRVLFVDFGNTEERTAEELRPMGKDLAEIPVLAIDAEIVGIPKSPAVNKKLKELITDSTVCTVNIKSIDEDGRCSIEPWQDIITGLKQSGLM